MIKFFRKIRYDLMKQNRTERKENILNIFLVNEPACRVGINTNKHD